MEFNSQRISLVHHHGRHFFVLEHQHGRRDVMWKRSIAALKISERFYSATRLGSFFNCFQRNVNYLIHIYEFTKIYKLSPFLNKTMR